MCKINCSGGCGSCAPDEHAFMAWWKPGKGPEQQGDTWEMDMAERAFSAGWHAGKKYAQAEALEVRGEH